MPDVEATHLASGKVRELYALDDGAAAPRRLGPDLDVRRRPADRDPRQGARSDRAVGVLVRPDSSTSSPTTARASGRRALARMRRLEMLPVEFVVRGYLSGSAWVDYLADGAVCGHELPAGLRESERLSAPIVTPATKAASGHDLNISEAGGRGAVRRGARMRPPGTRRSRLYELRRTRMPPVAASSSPTRSSSSGSTPKAWSRWPTRR